MTISTGQRAKRGTGSIREKRPGAWEVRIPIGGGTQMSRMVHGTREEADAVRAELLTLDICSPEFAALLSCPMPDPALGGWRPSRTLGGKRLRDYLTESGRELRCDGCNLATWLGEPIPLDVDHKNGDAGDNRLSNLRLLCANCHRLTPTWGHRPRKAHAEVIVRRPRRAK